MSETESIQKLLQELAQRGDACLADKLASEGTFDLLPASDRLLLAEMLVSHFDSILDGAPDHARQCLDRALLLAGDDERIAVKAGRCLLKRRGQQNLSWAADLFQRAVDRAPASQLNRFYLGCTLLQLAHLQDGEALYQRAKEELEFVERGGAALGQAHRQLLWWALGQIWHCIAVLSGEACDYIKALAYYRKTAPYKPRQKNYWSDYGKILWDVSLLLGRHDLWDQAIQCYQKALRFDDSCVATHFNLGRCYHHCFEASWNGAFFAKADACYARCRALTEGNSDIYRQWGRLLALQGQLRRDSELLERASDQLESCRLLDGDDPVLLLDLAEVYIQRGSLGEELDALQQAADMLDAVAPIDVVAARLRRLQGELALERAVYFGEERLLQAAAHRLLDVLTTHPQDICAWHSLALTHLASADGLAPAEALKKAHDSMERAAEFSTLLPPHFWNDWGIIAMKLAEALHDKQWLHFAVDRFEKALSVERRLLDGAPPSVEYLYNYACTLDFLGDLEENHSHYVKAINALKKAVEIDASYTPAWYSLALTLAHLGEAEADLEALEQSCYLFEKLALQDPEDEHVWNEWGLALINVALLVHEEAFPDRSRRVFHSAEEKLRHALALGNETAHYNLACLYALQGEAQAALAQLHQADRCDALPALDELLHDEWLASLRHSDEFAAFVQTLQRRQDG